MARRTFHRAPEAERRHDLIEATLDCIAEYGLEGATVRQIAIKAGVTAGFICHEKSVYTQHHAADKEDGQENTDDQRNVGFLVCPQRS